MRISKIVTAAVVALTFGTWAQTAQSAPTITTPSGYYAPFPLNVSTLDSFITFEDATTNPLFANNTVITNQFASAGVTFTPLANGGVRYNSCGPEAWSFTTNMYYGTVNTYGPGCATNSIDDSFSLTFNGIVQEAAFAIYGETSGGAASIQALLNGIVVATLSYASLYQNYVVVSGGLFDELRFLEGSNPSSYVVLDSLGFSYAEVSNVPAPGALALLGLGLLGIGAFRRKKAA